MIISATFLSFVKVSSSVLAGAYGIYATITDFHELKDGRKRLTARGRLGLALLLLATIVGITSDGFKEKQERDRQIQERARLERDQRERDAETKRLEAISENLRSDLEIATGTQQKLADTSSALQKTAVISTETLHTSQRLLDPIPSQVKILATFQIPVDQAEIRRYASRIWGSPSLPDIKPGDPGSPNEDAGADAGEVFLHRFSTQSQIFVTFRKAARSKSDLMFRISCTPPYDARRTAYLEYYGGLTDRPGALFLGDSKNIYFVCSGDAVKDIGDSTLYSVEDLQGSYVVVGIKASGLIIDLSPHITYPKFEFYGLTIVFPGGRRLLIPSLTRRGCDDYIDTACFQGKVTQKVANGAP